MIYTMKEVCKLTGLSYEALKFYCNEGLVPHVKRDKNNHRLFDERDLGWIQGLLCLKNCDMSIVEMKEYMNLCLQGPDSISIRQRILDDKKKELQDKIQHIEESIAYIDRKQQYYQDVLDNKIEYTSNIWTK